ncbi:MAG: trypsin-like peptidase domain-containing protein [Planctomycetota bacterium]|jgi:serine protease Do|nr:trypsin-like peptidase domain-containing protein [Planctomycetota bacterium]
MKKVLTLFAILAALVPATATASSVRANDYELTPGDQAAITSATALSRAYIAVAKMVRPAVVNIRVERRVMRDSYNNPFEFFRDIFPGFPNRFSRRMPPRQRTEFGQGSGVIVSGNGYILTNNHVVGEADSIRVVLFDGREVPAELIGSDPNTDVAVIKIDADNLFVAKVGDSELVEVGEMVMAIGNPFGLDSAVTTGIVSASGRSGMNIVEIEDFIQTDAAINPGNSGGPLVNLRGEVIGINTAILSPLRNAQGIGFAIPVNMAKTVMESLIAHKRVTVAYLGVETQPLEPGMEEYYGLKSTRGALIRSVTKDSPGDKAGLKREDIVVRWGRREIIDDQQLRNLVTMTPPGEPVEVEVIREGQSVLLEVTMIPSTDEVLVRGRGDRFLQGLGIQITEITPELLDRIGYEADAEGVLVTAVEPNSPAHRLGLMVGSIILNVAGKDVRSPEELFLAISEIGPRSVFDIVWRNGMYLRRARIRGM